MLGYLALVLLKLIDQLVGIRSDDVATCFLIGPYNVLLRAVFLWHVAFWWWREGVVGLALQFPVYLWLLVQQVAACRLPGGWWVWICFRDVLVVSLNGVKWRFRFEWSSLRDLLFFLFCTNVFYYDISILSACLHSIWTQKHVSCTLNRKNLTVSST